MYPRTPDGAAGILPPPPWHYADALAVSRDVETFTSTKGIRLEEMDDDQLGARRTMMELDPPEHTRLCRLVNRSFTRRTVESYEDSIRALAAEVLDEALASGAFDFVTDVAARLPMRMLGRLLGTSDADGHQLVEWGDAFLGNSDPDFTTHVVDTADTEEFRFMPFRSPAAIEVFEYAKRQAAERRACPRHDVIWTMMRHPSLWQAWRSDPSLTLSAVEEVLRTSAVTMHFRRTATRPATLGGKRVAAGDKVVMWFCSANHDDEGFPRPWRFDLARNPNDHMAFGRNGPQLCPGAWLARMEARLVLEELMKRVDRLDPNGEPEFRRSNFIAGIKHLQVHYPTATCSGSCRATIAGCRWGCARPLSPTTSC